MRSAKAPAISAGVMMAKVIWKHDEDRFRDGLGELMDAVERQPAQEDAAQAADDGAARREGEAVADDQPEHRDQAGDGEALHDRGEHVLLAHHAAVEQRQARNGHHQHERRRGQHPGGVAGVELGLLVGAPVPGPGRSSVPAAPRPASTVLNLSFIVLPSGLELFELVRGITALRRRTRRCGCGSPARSTGRRSCRHRSCRCRPPCGSSRPRARPWSSSITDLDLDLRQEAHGVLGAAIDLGLALLSAEPLDLAHRQSLDAERGQRVADLVQLERLEDRHDHFHFGCPPPGGTPAPKVQSRGSKLHANALRAIASADWHGSCCALWRNEVFKYRGWSCCLRNLPLWVLRCSQSVHRARAFAQGTPDPATPPAHREGDMEGAVRRHLHRRLRLRSTTTPIAASPRPSVRSPSRSTSATRPRPSSEAVPLSAYVGAWGSNVYFPNTGAIAEIDLLDRPRAQDAATTSSPSTWATSATTTSVRRPTCSTTSTSSAWSSATTSASPSSAAPSATAPTSSPTPASPGTSGPRSPCRCPSSRSTRTSPSRCSATIGNQYVERFANYGIPTNNYWDWQLGAVVIGLRLRPLRRLYRHQRRRRRAASTPRTAQAASSSASARRSERRLPSTAIEGCRPACRTTGRLPSMVHG